MRWKFWKKPPPLSSAESPQAAEAKKPRRWRHFEAACVAGEDTGDEGGDFVFEGFDRGAATLASVTAAQPPKPPPRLQSEQPQLQPQPPPKKKDGGCSSHSLPRFLRRAASVGRKAPEKKVAAAADKAAATSSDEGFPSASSGDLLSTEEEAPLGYCPHCRAVVRPLRSLKKRSHIRTNPWVKERQRPPLDAAVIQQSLDSGIFDGARRGDRPVDDAAAVAAEAETSLAAAAVDESEADEATRPVSLGTSRQESVSSSSSDSSAAAELASRLQLKRKVRRKRRKRRQPQQQVYEQQAYEQQAYDQQAYEQQVYDQQVYEQQVYEQRVYEQQGYEQQVYEQQVYEQQVYEQQVYEQQGYEQNCYEQQWPQPAMIYGSSSNSDDDSLAADAEVLAIQMSGADQPTIMDEGVARLEFLPQQQQLTAAAVGHVGAVPSSGDEEPSSLWWDPDRRHLLLMARPPPDTSSDDASSSDSGSLSLSGCGGAESRLTPVLHSETDFDSPADDDDTTDADEDAGERLMFEFAAATAAQPQRPTEESLEATVQRLAAQRDSLERRFRAAGESAMPPTTLATTAVAASGGDGAQFAREIERYRRELLLRAMASVRDQLDCQMAQLRGGGGGGGHRSVRADLHRQVSDPRCGGRDIHPAGAARALLAEQLACRL